MPATERTLVLVKPDGVQRQLVGRILARYEERGLKVVGLKLVQVDRDLAERHYAAHREKPFFAGLVDFIISAPLVAARPRGPERDRGRPRDQRRDPAARGGAGHDPRRLRARDRPEHRPRVGRPGGGRGRARACGSRAGELLRLRARRRPLGARPERVGPRSVGRDRLDRVRRATLLRLERRDLERRPGLRRGLERLGRAFRPRREAGGRRGSAERRPRRPAGTAPPASDRQHAAIAARLVVRTSSPRRGHPSGRARSARARPPARRAGTSAGGRRETDRPGAAP